MMPMYPKAMMQPLLAEGVVRYVGEPVAVVLTEERYQGEDAAELVAASTTSRCPWSSTRRRRWPTRCCCFPEAGTNVCFRNPSPRRRPRAGRTGGRGGRHRRRPGCRRRRRRLRGGRLAGDPQPARGRGAAGGARRRGGLGHGRPADASGCPTRAHRAASAPCAACCASTTPPCGSSRPTSAGPSGAKFGADVEHAVIALAARHVGRPARWVETRSENMIAMTHGRAQVQTVTVGGDRDGRSGPTGCTSCRTAAPIPSSARCCPPSPCSWRPASTTSRCWRRRSRAASPTPRRSVPTAGPGAPRRRRPSSGRWTCSLPRSGWTRPRCGART